MRSRKLIQLAAATTLLAGMTAGTATAASSVPTAASAHGVVPQLSSCPILREYCVWVYYTNQYFTTITGSLTIQCDGTEYAQGITGSDWVRFSESPCG